MLNTRLSVVKADSKVVIVASSRVVSFWMISYRRAPAARPSSGISEKLKWYCSRPMP